MIDTLVERVKARDPRAIARAISIVEDGTPESAALVAALRPMSGRAVFIGITGPPGAGKSTLVASLIAEIRKQGRTAGVLAVDPTSPYSGGALLGDRVRMQAHALDDGVFIRSMATRGHLGGLARATADAAVVLDAAGFDVMLIETVGVGQAEVEIVRAADIVIVVVAPGGGDDVQALKAGIMEIGDIFVVNKADLDGADRAVASLESMIALGTFAAVRWRPPVVRTVATTGVGVPEILEIVDRFRATSDDAIEAKRARDRVRPSPSAATVPDDGLAGVFDHVGIAVKDAAALGDVLRLVGLSADAPEDLAGPGVRVRFVRTGAGSIEFVEPLAAESAIAKFLHARGVKEAALHHIAIRVHDLDRVLAALAAQGVRLIDRVPRPGAEGARIAFVHPDSTSGVLVELVERDTRALR